MDQKEFMLENADFDSFLETYSRIEESNIPMSPGCVECNNFDICYGKGFFSIANFYDLPCLQGCGEVG